MSPVVEHPPAHLLRRWVLDVSVTLAVGALSLPPLFRDGRAPSTAALVLLVVLTVPVVLRRRYPVAVFGVTLVATVVGTVAVDQQLAGLAVLVALYTVAAQRPRRAALTCAALLEAAAVVAALTPSELDWWFALLTLSGLVAAALGLGLFTATRRAYLAELRDRATRLERERDQQGELAAAAERSRIAREIHDIVAHHLTVIVALSDGAVAASAASPARAAEVMRTVSATGREALTDTRRLLGVLRDDSAAAEDGAQDTGHRPHRPAPDLHELDALVHRVREAGLPVVHEVQGSAGPLAPGLQLTAYRVVQEALTNSLKHAGAGASATVRLRHTPDELAVEVSDDGAGRRGAPVGSGRGLVGMRERVAAFGGEVEAGPRPGGGWVVTARLRPDGAAVHPVEVAR
ncbi:sensor histidine kinase [Rhodococcus antarcticus]|uniref:histidine kinase n=1 Tax=Rhodococcus antarcticus TaxID=2987751 RepID=A0ABY6NYS9_9NOCA|nr:sensor histidine kinase [Rhodococcus antarcticus]UZJ24148.1 sensor histidine kinase [Rhodococcus antarcticus]